MALNTEFVAAVLEGIEGTLGELIDRVDVSELRASLDVLQSRVTALRVSIELRAFPYLLRCHDSFLLGAFQHMVRLKAFHCKRNPGNFSNSIEFDSNPRSHIGGFGNSA